MHWPNFLVIGDIKAATTSLHYYLKQHPDVFMPENVKELRYFSYDSKNLYEKQAVSTRVTSEADYLQYFEGVTNEKAIGEASPNYLRSYCAPLNIKSKIPGVKLIVSLRNPAERLFSLYMMGLRKNLRKSFQEMVFSNNSAWVKGNFTYFDLKNYYNCFSNGQIQIVLFENLVAEPLAAMGEIYRYLDVRNDFQPNVEIHNKGGIPKNRITYAVLVKAKDMVKKVVEPDDKLKGIWKSYKESAVEPAKISPETKAEIIKICREDILMTQDLIQVDLSHWLRDCT